MNLEWEIYVNNISRYEEMITSMYAHIFTTLGEKVPRSSNIQSLIGVSDPYGSGDGEGGKGKNVETWQESSGKG